MLKYWTSLLGVLLGVAAIGGAAEQKVIVTAAAPSGVEIPAGGTATLTFTIEVARGYHVQANPPSEDYLIATKLELAQSDGLAYGPPAFPQAKTHQLMEMELATYDGTFGVTVVVSASPNATIGERNIQCALRYQACDDRSCLPPKSFTFELALRVVAAKSANKG